MPFDVRPAETEETMTRPATLQGAGVRLAALALATGTGATLAALAPTLGGADPDLARLMMAMALLKAVIGSTLIGAIGWRFKWRAPIAELVLYLAASAAMSAGVVLMARLAAPLAAAVLLHAGLFGAILLLLRDRTIVTKVNEEVARRRARSVANPAPRDSAGGAP